MLQFARAVELMPTESIWLARSGRKRPGITRECARPDCVREFCTRADRPGRYCCQECAHLSRRRRVRVRCCRCGQEFDRKLSKVTHSRSRIFFCSRECKDQAQQLSDGITAIHPPHYGSGRAYRKSFLRRMATKSMPIRCLRCGFNEFIEAIEIHHIDGDRTNNDPGNLCALCANCHRAVERGRFRVLPDGTVVKGNPNAR